MEKKPEGTPTPEAGKEKQPTLQEILADKEKSALFGAMLESEGKENSDIADIAKRLMDKDKDKDKKITEEDLKTLMGEKGLLEDFLGRMESVKACSSTMTKEAMMNRILGGNSKKFDMIVKAVGVDGARDSIVPQLEMLAMKDHTRFKTMAGSFQFLERKDTEIKEGKGINDAIKKFCDEHNLTEEEYSDIEKESTSEGRIKFFEGKFKEKFDDIDKIGKRFKFFSGKEKKAKEGSRHDANEIDKIKQRDELNEYIKEQVGKVHSRVDIENLKSQIEPRLGKIGNVLGEAVLENDDMNEAFRRILRGEEGSDREESFGFKDANEMMLTKDALNEKFKEWKKKDKNDEMTDEKKQEAFFNSYVGKKMGNKKGFWGKITETLIKEIVSSFK